MQITTSRSFRHRLLTACAAIAWAVSLTLFVVLAVAGQRYPLHVALLFSLTVAATSTIGALVSGQISPVEALYGHIYQAGKQDCSRPHAQPTLVAQSDVERHRAQRASSDAG